MCGGKKKKKRSDDRNHVSFIFAKTTILPFLQNKKKGKRKHFEIVLPMNLLHSDYKNHLLLLHYTSYLCI